VKYAILLRNLSPLACSRSGVSSAQIGNMVLMQRKTSLNSYTQCHCGYHSGAPLIEEASPSQGEPTLSPETPNLQSADPETKEHSMMFPLTQMIDLMLLVLLASLCKEEGVGTSQTLLLLSRV